ncbi:DHA2 family efflux MFS transporter permease subunit [Neptuniibacter sp. 1_MG-2023]|uniref:DHA2 family efflux MFS transporter permease subunit n=1 Tax=Neptuniibacter sp. 1_MG-2023 TaxID=3062662 RepID=UPI0026E12101|nr:DHA2 family efflux MFS transporter permease subunit [Neptuniibacter sp. 1_MG-2023]MDO6595179.1 DHA2 family efflux MFS transporter permease subunit [Neptuniibacter sp. 1_MG-2023]
MNDNTSTLQSIPKRSWGIAAVTGAGAFMAMLDSTVANLAIESIREDFSSSLSIVQWVATGYLCALAVSLPASAWLGVRYGYGRLWASSLAVFVLASIFCAIAPDPSTLIVARLIQGLAGGLMVPAGQAVIGSTIEKRQLGRIFGTLGLVIALGPAIGPAVGGFLLDATSWRWLFWINVPIGLIALIAARGLVPRGVGDSNRVMDFKGFALLSIGLPLLLFGAFEIGLSGNSQTVIVALIFGTALVILFVFTALQSKNPLINLRLLQRTTFSTATITTGLTGANMYGGLLVIPIYLQLVAGMEPLSAGLWLLVMGLGSALVLPIAGSLTDRFGPGVVSLAGTVLLLFSAIPFVFPQVPSSTVLTVSFVARGVGMALAQMPAMTAAYTAVSGEEMGDATTLVNIVQRMGGAIGAVGLVVIVQHTGGSTSMTAHNIGFTSLAAISALAIITAGLMCRQSKLNPVHDV